MQLAFVRPIPEEDVPNYLLTQALIFVSYYELLQMKAKDLFLLLELVDYKIEQDNEKQKIINAQRQQKASSQGVASRLRR